MEFGAERVLLQGQARELGVCEGGKASCSKYPELPEEFQQSNFIFFFFFQLLFNGYSYTGLLAQSNFKTQVRDKGISGHAAHSCTVL